MGAVGDRPFPITGFDHRVGHCVCWPSYPQILWRRGSKRPGWGGRRYDQGPITRGQAEEASPVGWALSSAPANLSSSVLSRRRGDPPVTPPGIGSSRRAACVSRQSFSGLKGISRWRLHQPPCRQRRRPVPRLSSCPCPRQAARPAAACRGARARGGGWQAAGGQRRRG